jgi:GR25 family glycosyltransferase involved in LPS biosynthesis
LDGSSIDRQVLVREGTIEEDCIYLPGSLGCALSHISLWKEAVQSDRTITVFEDDVYCSPNFTARSKEVLSSAPAGWDLIKWGFNFDPLFIWADLKFAKAKLEFYSRGHLDEEALIKFDEEERSLIRIAHSFGLMAYSVTPRGARILLEKCLPLRRRNIPFPGAGVVIEDTGIDCAMCAAYSSMEAFVCIPPLVFSDGEQLSIREETDRASGSVVNEEITRTPELP